MERQFGQASVRGEIESSSKVELEVPIGIDGCSRLDYIPSMALEYYLAGSTDTEAEKRQGRPASERILTLLKMRGSQTSSALGAALGTTGENARQQLVKLAADGLVEARSQAKGVGRPQQEWELTERGHGFFPDTHGELAVSLIKAVRNTLGEAALDQLIAAREGETRATYSAVLEGVDDLEARIAALAAQRSAEGYMAEWRRTNEGDAWLLIENHCPICAAATTCQGFCRSELAVFRDVLGDGCTVEREEHILHGARRCAYRISPH